MSLKGHLEPVCIAVAHFTEIICCNTKITNVLIVFENRIVSSQPKATAGCDTLLKRNIDTILLSNTEITLAESGPLTARISFAYISPFYGSNTYDIHIFIIV